MPRAKPIRTIAAALTASVCIVFGAMPVAALATTGTNTDKRTVVTITDKGVTYTPRLTKMKLTTGATLRVHVINKTSGKHWFKFGTHRTKVLKPGQSYTFFYVLDITGAYKWQVELGKLSHKKAFHGVYNLPLPSHFH